MRRLQPLLARVPVTRRDHDGSRFVRGSCSPLTALDDLAKEVIVCEACPRLRRYCKKVAREKRRAYLTEEYWGLPVPGFGDPEARLVIVGLAPAAHGANRTGRIFTGDRSGEWLYRALYRAGFANQPASHSRGDGLKLQGAYVTCAVRCAPPDNKPTPREIKNCSHFLDREFAILGQARVFVALGGIALHRLWPLISSAGQRRPKFAHGVHMPLGNERHLLVSYHPSQQNTFTGRLTEPMFDAVFDQAKSLLRSR